MANNGRAMSNRFFSTGLTTGMSGSSIDHELALTLVVKERYDRGFVSRSRGSRGSATSFSTLLRGAPAPSKAGPWRRLRKALRQIARG